MLLRKTDKPMISIGVRMLGNFENKEPKGILNDKGSKQHSKNGGLLIGKSIKRVMTIIIEPLLVKI